ncbi:MAG: agmatine deiminase family protein [Saprospiraceae bacterium]
MHKPLLFSLLLAFCLIGTEAFGQFIHPTLSRNTDLSEFLLLNDTDLFAPGGLTNSSAPSGPVRAMAEWEELQALVVTWRGQQNTLLTEIIRNAREECTVIVCVPNQNTLTSAQNILTNANVDLSSNVDFVIAPSNSLWVRDYGPNSVYQNEVDSLYIIDWIYNRPRPQDDQLPGYVADHINAPMYSTSDAPTDLVHTGGNFMSDGMGTAFSSKLFLAENGPNNQYGQSNHSEAEVDAIMNQYMGITRYPKMENLPYDVIHHIDMHMKLLDEETLLVGEYPQGVADGPQIEANIQYVLSNYQSSFGTPYKVVRIPMPPEGGNYPNTGGDYRTYANAVFVNKTILVPFYQEQYDTTAQRIWEESMPGYRVVGINCNSIIPSLGAIHCITKEVGVNEPLRIVHKSLPDVVHSGDMNDYPVHALIQHHTGIASARVYYTDDPDAGVWNSVDMSPYNPMDTSDVWVANIPFQADDKDLYYYIEGSANSGKTLARPLPAPAGHWKFNILHVTGVADQNSNLELKSIYPNPASAITCIPVQTESAVQGEIKLVNALGQTVESIYQGSIPSGQSNYFIDASQYPAGVYFVQLLYGTESIQQKLIIQKK